MLKAEHITKQYQIPGGGHTVFDAVSDVSIELGDGGVAAIVGESGSGKSTLARVLSYVERPDGGRTNENRGVFICGTGHGWNGIHSAVGRMNSPADSKNGCVLPALWPPSPNTLSLTSPSADWMSR